MQLAKVLYIKYRSNFFLCYSNKKRTDFKKPNIFKLHLKENEIKITNQGLDIIIQESSQAPSLPSLPVSPMLLLTFTLSAHYLYVNICLFVITPVLLHIQSMAQMKLMALNLKITDLHFSRFNTFWVFDSKYECNWNLHTNKHLGCYLTL